MIQVKIDMTGWKMWEHGVPDSRLTVIKQTEDHINPTTGKRFARWLCKCSCDKHNQIVVIGTSLRNGNTKSCGCLMKEIVGENGKKYKKYNEYRIDGNVVVGLASNTQNEFYVDLKNFDKIKDFCWYESIRPNGFHMLMAKIPGTRNNITMHRLLGFKNYDHIDRNELNNLESNLRQATQQQNVQNKSKQKNNTSGVTGVVWYKDRCKWVAQIQHEGTAEYLSAYDNKEDAIKARLLAEIKFFGDFAPQKHLFEQYGIVNKM